MKTKHTHHYRKGRSLDVCDCGAFRHRDLSNVIVNQAPLDRCHCGKAKPDNADECLDCAMTRKGSGR